MMFYSQSRGEWTDASAVIVAGCYAGNGPEKNNPESQGQLDH